MCSYSLLLLYVHCKIQQKLSSVIDFVSFFWVTWMKFVTVSRKELVWADRLCSLTYCLVLASQVWSSMASTQTMILLWCSLSSCQMRWVTIEPIRKIENSVSVMEHRRVFFKDIWVCVKLSCSIWVSFCHFCVHFDSLLVLNPKLIRCYCFQMYIHFWTF